MRSLAPLQLALGVSPSEAANWRPDVNWCGSVTDAASADAVMKPIPGMVLSPLGQLVATKPGLHILLERADPDLQRADLLGQGDDDLAGQRGNVRRHAFGKLIDEFQRVLNACGQHQPELSQLGSDHVDQLGALAHQQGARPVQRQDRLLFGRLDRDEAHGRARHRLADRCRVARIRLAALDVERDVDRRHQLHFVPQRPQRARPEVARAARFHADQTRFQLAEERHHLTPAQRLADDHLARAVNTVNLKNVLREIETYDADIHV